VQGHLCSTGSDGYYYTGDHDYFRFTTPAASGDDITMTLDWPNAANFDLWLYRADGSTLVARDTGLTKPADIEASLDSGTEYVLMVVGYEGDPGEYTVTIVSPYTFTLDLDVSYGAGTLSLDYTLGTPEAATWANYLVLTSPTIQVIPLWTAPLPVLSPPIDIPIAFPFPSVGLAGIFTGLFTGEGPQVTVLEWVST